LKVSIIIGTIKLSGDIPNMKVEKYLSNLSYLGKLWVILGDFFFFDQIFSKEKEREYMRFFFHTFRQMVKFRHKNKNNHWKTNLQILGTTVAKRRANIKMKSTAFILKPATTYNLNCINLHNHDFEDLKLR
jgi:hypothetical protein